MRFEKSDFFVIIVGSVALINLCLIIINAIEMAKSGKVSNIGTIGIISKKIFEILSKEPIMDVEFQPANTGCLNKYEKLSLYKWSIANHCKCSRSVRRGECEDFEIFCANVSAISLNMTVWKNHNICVKRYGKKDFSIKNIDFQCPKGFKLCPGKTCIKESIKLCPITDVVINTINPNLSLYEESLGQRLPDQKKMFFTRKELKSKDLVDFKMVPGDYPCISPIESPRRLSGKTYPLFEFREYGCGIFGQDKKRNQLIDHKKELSVYLENKIPSKYEKYPNFKYLI